MKFLGRRSFSGGGSGSSPGVWPALSERKRVEGAPALSGVALAKPEPRHAAPKFILSGAEGLSDSLARHAVKPCTEARLLLQGFYCVVHSPLYPERAKRVERVRVKAPVPPAPRRQPLRTACAFADVYPVLQAQFGVLGGSA